MKAFAILIPCLCALAPRATAQFQKGADLSLAAYIEDHGVQYKEAGVAKDPLLILRDHGFNWVRLRLFLEPNGREGQVNSLPYTLRLARRVRDAGMSFLLDLHYSDGWADPGHQVMPAAWRGLSHGELVDRVHAYTKETLEAFRREGCPPQMVEVGNEITNGMLWPDGGPMVEPKKWDDIKNPTPADTEAWDRLADLLKAGIGAVREVEPSARVMIHIDKGGSRDGATWFFDQILERGVDFDVIGLSYYPFWHGTFDDLRDTLEGLSGSYGVDLVVVETAYYVSGENKKMPYPQTPEGQKAFLDALLRIVAGAPGGLGKGVYYWGGEWIEGASWTDVAWTGHVESRALFDDKGEMLPGVRAFEFDPGR